MTLSSISNMWYLWILTEAIMMLCLSLPTTMAYVELIGVEKAWKSNLQYTYCKVKPWIQRELSHTIKSRCACVWNIWWLILNLLCSWKAYLSFKTWKQFCKRTWAILFISFFYFFQEGIWVPIVFNILDTCPFFFSFFMNNFCIAPCLFSATETFEIQQQELRAFIWWMGT